MNNLCKVFFCLLFLITSNAAAAQVTVFGPHEFRRGSGAAPTISIHSFNATKGEAHLRLYNGDETGNNRISSATISVNGVPIFSPKDFSPKVHQIEATLNLEEVNSISVRLTGKPGGYLSLVITQEQEEVALPLISVSASPQELLLGQSSTLTWTTEYADSCTIEPELGNVPLSGSLVVSPSATTTYTITASSQAGSIFKTVTVDVAYPLPTVSIEVEPNSIIIGDSATLSWSADNADSCTIMPDIGSVAPTGSVTISPLEITTYTITATGPGGSATTNVTLEVTYPAPTATLSAELTAISSGESSLLAWTTQYAQTCFLEPDIGSVPCSGERAVTPVQDTTYTLTAIGLSGNTTTQATITVTPASPLSLTVLSPIDGETISSTDVQVSGTVSHAEGLETGVTVNGVMALVHDGTFVANHVPLREGENIITVRAVDVNGEYIEKNILLNAEPAPRFVELITDTQSGLAPMEIILSLNSNFPLATPPTIDDSGPGVVDFLPSTEPNTWNVSMNEPGIYIFTVEVQDEAGAYYNDTVAVLVMDRAVLDGLLQAKWDGMKAAMSAGNIEAVVQGFTLSQQEIFREIFTLTAGNIAQIATEMQDIELIYQKNNTAEYRIKRDVVFEGVPEIITFYIYFQRGTDGIWLIRDF